MGGHTRVVEVAWRFQGKLWRKWSVYACRPSTTVLRFCITVGCPPVSSPRRRPPLSCEREGGHAGGIHASRTRGSVPLALRHLLVYPQPCPSGMPTRRGHLPCRFQSAANDQGREPNQVAPTRLDRLQGPGEALRLADRGASPPLR